MNAEQRKKKAHDLRKLSKPVEKARDRYRRLWSDWVDSPGPEAYQKVLDAMAARVVTLRAYLKQADRVTGSHR